MRNLRNIDREAVRSLVRDGFLPSEILIELGMEDRLVLEQVEEIAANRLWIKRGMIFIAVAVNLSNFGDYDRTVDECRCETAWAPHIELVAESEEAYSETFVAGSEDFAQSCVLNPRIVGARLPKCGGALDGILIFKVYGLPTRQQLAPRMPLRIKILFTNGLEITTAAVVRVQAIHEIQRIILAEASPLAPHTVERAVRLPRTPLFDDIGEGS